MSKKNKIDQTVVRNGAFRAGKFEICERHNERQNESYYNANVIVERSDFNVHFRSCEGTYEQAFRKMVDDGTISLRGLQKNAKVFDELVFDVNTSYFEENGGYDFAKRFFEEAYQLAIKETGGEQYILSAVMHADEVNKAVSDELDRDVYHYHLHVVYIPVVDKEVKWSTRCKDPTLVGTVKEVIKQVSHSKKWPRIKTEKGWINSYSLLQDRYYDHMKAAGFEGFERGTRGSTVEHLSVLEYNTKMEMERLSDTVAEVQKQEQVLDTLDKQAVQKQKKLDKLDEKITVKTEAAATVDEVKAMGRPSVFGNGFSVTADEYKKLKALAKKGASADEKISEERNKRKKAERERDDYKAQFEEEKKKRPSITQNLSWVNKFLAALKRAPKRIMAVIEDIMRQPPEQPEPERNINKSKEIR